MILAHQIKKAEFWNNISPVKFTKQNEADLEQLFSLSPIKKQPSSNNLTSKKSSVNITTSILDLRKTNNISILLSQFKV